MMEWFNILMTRLRALFRRESVLQDIEEELRVHVEMETETNIKRGMPPDEARAAALKSFGNVGRNTELGYDIRGGGWLETLWQDLRFGARMLLKQPGFSLIALLTLALGIGANTAIFSVVNAVLLRPLPYREAERIVAIQELNKEGKLARVTPANFLDWRAQQTTFASLAAISTRRANLALTSEAERINLAVVSANFFDVFGLHAERGRLFAAADEQAGHAPVVVVSHSLWQSRFGGANDLVGRNTTLDGKSYTVVGIAPQGFQYPDETEAWLPPLRLAPEANERMDVTQDRGFGYLSAVALLKPGVSLAQAAGEMETITARLRRQYPDTNNPRFNRVVSLQKHLVGETDTMLWLLFGAVCFVLLIACANVANLSLARAAARQKEMAIRAALGASRGRVIGQLLTESTLLALAGGALGWMLAVWGVELMTRLLPRDFPRLREISLDWRVLLFTLLASVSTGILFGLAPAWQSAKTDVHETLKESARGATGGWRQRRLRHLLIVAEIALSLVLLVGAGLLLRSFTHLQSVSAGFTPQQVLTARLSPAGAAYRADPAYISYFRRVIERVRLIPGIEAVGAINKLPLSSGDTAGYRIEGRPLLTPDKWPDANYRTVSSDYFRALSIPIVQGRAFNERDNEAAPQVMIVNQALARRDFPGENPVGKRINLGNTDRTGQPVWFEIVGVAANVRSPELAEESQPEFYLSGLQDTFAEMSLVIRAAVEPASLASAVRQAAAEVDKTQPVSNLTTMEAFVSEAFARPRFNLVLLGLFGGLALLLSAAGIYGVMAYGVAQRKNEVGLRLALGAQPHDVMNLILRQGLRLISVGLVLGLVSALALTRLMKSLLFGVNATDAVTFAAVTLLLLVVALLACLIPARRATRVDPLATLRQE
jgi:putative ABC transport system permease protein